MARTINGNCTGQAAQIGRRELYESIRRDHKEQQEKIVKNRQLFRVVLAELALTDPKGWESWYDSDAIPDKLNWLEIDPVIKTIQNHIHDVRLAQLSAEK